MKQTATTSNLDGCMIKTRTVLSNLSRIVALGVFSVLLLIVSVNAQTAGTGAITGRIIDVQNPTKGVPGATVKFVNLNALQSYTTRTDKDGYFTLDQISSSDYLVTISPPTGYKRASPTLFHLTANVMADSTIKFSLESEPVTVSSPIASKLTESHYYALVIGNNKYQFLRNLKTAERDAVDTVSELRERYGFQTKLLVNATRAEIVAALQEYRRTLNANDSLLVYYAGHGYRDKEIDRTYWLPVDAKEGDDANWISADDITSKIRGIPARLKEV